MTHSRYIEEYAHHYWCVMLFTIHKPLEMITYDDVWVVVCSHGLIDDPYGFPMESFLWEKERASIEFGLGWQEFSPSLWTFCCFWSICAIWLGGWLQNVLTFEAYLALNMFSMVDE
jgi:hypothetical protein